MCLVKERKKKSIPVFDELCKMQVFKRIEQFAEHLFWFIGWRRRQMQKSNQINQSDNFYSNKMTYGYARIAIFQFERIKQM